jgi:hypothetical protein
MTLDDRLRRVGYHLTRRTLGDGTTVWFVVTDSPYGAKGYHCKTLAEVRELCQALTECRRCYEIDESYQHDNNKRY